MDARINNICKTFPKELKNQLITTYGSLKKFYATVYLIAKNKHNCQLANIPGSDQRLKTIKAYQGLIRFTLDEAELDGQDILDQIASDYLDDFVQYKEQDFGMSNDEFIAIIKKIG